MTTPIDVHTAQGLRTRAAERLQHATATRTPCAPVRDLVPAGADADPSAQMAFGYAVQRILTEAAERDGHRIVGSKIGLAAPAVRQQLGVDQPDFGVLFADMARREDETIAISQLLQPKIEAEAEVAFVLGADLDQPDLTLETVSAAVDTAVAALEIVDSRVAHWNIRLVDTIADNASCGLYVLGSTPRPLEGLDLPAMTMAMTANGETVSHGVGSACLGDPCAALPWLARTAQRFGSPLRTGDLVLSGALGPVVVVEPDTTYEATIDGLGTVRASFGANS